MSQMDKSLTVYCVIPAFNEANNIICTIAQVKPNVDKVIIIDDGSSDDTYVLAKSQEVVVLRHGINRGQGASLQTGNEYALKNKADIIVHFDADGQFVADEIQDLILPIKKNEAEIAFGSRFLGKKSNLPIFKKFFIFPIARLVNRVLFNVNLSDPQCGFRALSRQAAENIKIEQAGAGHCSEILAKTVRYNIKYKEVPVTVIYKKFGQNFNGGIRVIKDYFYSKILE